MNTRDRIRKELENPRLLSDPGGADYWSAVFCQKMIDDGLEELLTSEDEVGA